MKLIRLGMIVVVLAGGQDALADGGAPPAALEVLKQVENEAAEIDRRTEAELARWREKSAAALQDVQDRFCRQGLLDEALGVRELSRALRAGAATLPLAEALPAVKRAFRPFEDEANAILRKAEDDLAAREENAADELKKVQDAFAREAKLDEAVAVRDLIRNLRAGTAPGTGNALPDPVYVNNPPADVGKVFYYETTGANVSSLYGTDIYTTGSHLGTAAVHCGLLKQGEKGVVKVTILPGQAQYTTTTRNGITSWSYGSWGASFRVERAYLYQVRRPWTQRVAGLEKPNG